MELLRRAFIVFVAILLVVVVGLSILLYEVQARHAQIITEETHAVQRLEVTDRAALILAEQREDVAATLLQPIDRHAFQQQTKTFQALMRGPLLADTAQRRRQQRTILVEQEEFSQRALRLSSSPSSAQVQEVRALGATAFTALGRLRTGHAVNFAALHNSETILRRFSLVMILVTNGVIVALAIAGLYLLNTLARRQAEAATLRATDKLRREFIAFAAHELRNPASAIQTGVSMLKEPDLEPELRQEVVSSISRSADALTRLIFNLLAMGRTEEGRLRLQRAPISIITLFDELLGELAVYHPGIDARVQRHLPEAQVDVDPEYVKLLIANIIDNAVKYSPPKSTISAIGEICDHMVEIHIHNMGPGIPPEMLPKIFDMYETSGTAPQSVRRGVGLGLYMARLLVEAHGGRIWAESQPGEGATISFSLPIFTSETTASSAR